MNGKRPGRLVQMMPFSSSSLKMAEPTWYSLLVGLSIGDGLYSSSVGACLIGRLVERSLHWVLVSRPMMVRMEWCMCFLAAELWRPGKVARKPLSIVW